MEPLRADDPEGYGHYQLLARLGAGGMGQVFLARSPSGRLVAVKVVHTALAAEPDFRARFRREVAAASAVSGAFTAAVIDADPDGPSPWLATAYLPGLSLQETVTMHGPLPPGSCTALATALAEGLTAVHRAGIVHRDLKPSNVLLTPDGPRVIDFGIAHAADASAITQTGMEVGTPGYIPPEQTAHQDTGPPGDVFSLGAVLTFAATGDGPFGTGALHATMYRTLHEAPRLDAVTDPGLRGLIAACLEKDPARRPTLQQLLQWLVEHLPESTAPQSTGWLPATVTTDITERSRRVPQRPVRLEATVPAERPARQGPSRRAVLGLGLAAGAVGVAAAGGAWLLSGGPDFLWTWEYEGGHLYKSPVVSGGIALTVTSDDGENSLVALDAKSGAQRWRESYRSPLSEVLGIFDGTGYLAGATRELIAFDPASGKEKWRYRADRLGTEPSLVTGGGMVFLSAVDGKTGKPGLLALSAADRQPKWHLPVSVSTFPNPVFANGIVYLGAGRDFTAVDAATGKARWSTKALSDFVGRPVIVGDVLYVSTEGALNAVKAATGELLWYVPNSSAKGTAEGWVPTVIGESVYLASMTGSLHAYARTATAPGKPAGGPGQVAPPQAKELWKADIGGNQNLARANPRLLTPAVGGGVVSVFNGDTTLVGLDAATGRQRWRQQVKAERTELPCLANGTVHLATRTGVLSVAPGSGEVVGRTGDLKTGRLSVVDDIVYFSGGPLDRDLPSTVYAMRAPGA